MDKQEFFQSYMDHWGITDVLLECYVDMLTIKPMLKNETDDNDDNKTARTLIFKQLLFEHHIQCKEQQVFEDEIRQLQEQLERIKK